MRSAHKRSRLMGSEYSFVAYDLFVKYMAFLGRDVIDVGVEILVTKELQAELSSIVACYEGELYNLIRQGLGSPVVPVVLHVETKISLSSLLRQ